MKLFVGLWNPWVQYATTRHNAWFLLLQQFCDRHNATDFLYNSKFHAEVSTWLYEWVQYIAVKPMLFMNRSWWSLVQLMNFYKIPPEDCLLFYDDIDLPLWVTKLKYWWSHGWHNGVRDIYEKTGTNTFRKIKFGVWRPEHTAFSVADYVLGQFSATDLKLLDDAAYEIDQKVQQYIKNTGK